MGWQVVLLLDRLLRADEYLFADAMMGSFT